MSEEKDLDEIVEEPPQRLVLILLAGAFIILILGTQLVLFLGTNFFAWKPGAMSLIAGLRIILILYYPICFLPMAVLMELFYVAWKRRPFRPLNIAIAGALFAEIVILFLIITSVFEMIFPDLELVDQVPVLAISLGITLLALAATSRIRRIRSFLKKAFED